MNNKGLLLVFSGPSGVGKGTVLKEYLKKHPHTAFSVSATTRKPRAGEIHGQHYFFLSREEFELLVENGGLLEHAQFCLLYTSLIYLHVGIGAFDVLNADIYIHLSPGKLTLQISFQSAFQKTVCSGNPAGKFKIPVIDRTDFY